MPKISKSIYLILKRARYLENTEANNAYISYV